MRRSEIIAALHDSYGSQYGDALANDLCLQQLEGMTLLAALDAGIDHDTAWQAFCDEMDADDTVRFHHRYHWRRSSDTRRT
ncbi:MAG: DUF3046 domain-containing protein [Bowdeniella nasicola]|nr:DUF3046 domain-containing protein [Bowdeniella nasicola]